MRIFFGLAILFLAGAFFAVAHSPTVSSYQSPSDEVDFVGLVNEYRAQDGAGPISRSDCLTTAAREWSASMAANNSLKHSQSGYVSQYCGTSSGIVGSGEVILNATGPADAQRALGIFQNSPQHDEIIRTAKYEYGGAGFFRDGSEKLWVTFIVADCGTCTAAVTSSPSDTVSQASDQAASNSVNTDEGVGVVNGAADENSQNDESETTLPTGSFDAQAFIQSVRALFGSESFDPTEGDEALTVSEGDVFIIYGATEPNGVVRVYTGSDIHTRDLTADETGEWFFVIARHGSGVHRIEAVPLDTEGNELTEPLFLMDFEVQGEVLSATTERLYPTLAHAEASNRAADLQFNILVAITGFIGISAAYYSYRRG